MSNDITDRTDPISQVNNRLVPPQRVKQAKTVGAEVRINQARRSFASLAATAADPPLQQRQEFVISDLGKLRTGRLERVRLLNDDNADRLGFTLDYEYRGRDVLKHVSGSELVHNKLRKMLIGLGLKFRAAASATVYRIEVEPVVPASLSVSATATGKTAVLTLSNVVMLGASTYEIPIESLDRKVVDALIELVSAGNRDFYSLIAKSGARRD